VAAPRVDIVLDAFGRRWDPGALERDEAIAALAARQHGVIAARQLCGLGVDDQAVRRRVGSSRLFVVAPGVFAVGHPGLPDAARLLSAALSYGPGSVVGHRSALLSWRLARFGPRRVDVIAMTGSERRGTRRHRVLVHPDDIVDREGVPVTAVGRTLADSATVLRAAALERAVHEAQVLGLLRASEIRRAAVTSTRRAGGARLRSLLAEIDPAVRLRSHLERRFLARVRAEGHPAPRVNALIAVGRRFYEVDMAWPRAKVAIELDSRFHDTAIARRADALRDRDFAGAGWRVVRLRSSDLDDRPISSWIPSDVDGIQDSLGPAPGRGASTRRLRLRGERAAAEALVNLSRTD
jgi:very-short-patch-repair endonuclease